MDNTASQQTEKFEILKHGSLFLRADFHLHTRADKEFTYKGKEDRFITDYVQHLKDQGINIALISNHNKFDKKEFRNLRKNAKKEEIFLLPGVELSVNDGANGIHTLVVFSDAWLEPDKDNIGTFLSTTFKGKTPQEYEQGNGRSSQSITETIETLDSYHHDYFLIFAHVAQDNGLWKGLDGGRIGDLGKNPKFRKRCLAFHQVRKDDLKAKVQDWLGGYYPAEVEGSDCKSLEEIGAKKQETWLKLGAFTFDAVKYALLNHQNQIRSKKPEPYKHSHIKSITFVGGTLDGKTLSFSPYLNTLIGIRGSGKSSILETLRHVLNIPLGKQADEQKYKEKLVKHTLRSGGYALVHAVDQQGQEYQIKRMLGEDPKCSMKGISQPGITIGETILQKPLYFGQKDLASIGEGCEKELIEKFIEEGLRGLRHKIKEQEQEVKDAVVQSLKSANVDEKIAEWTQQKTNVEFHLKKYAEHGVEEKFKKQTDFNEDERKIEDILHDTETYKKGLGEFLSAHEDSLKNHASYQSKQNPDFFQDFLHEYTAVIRQIEQQKKDAQGLEELLRKLALKFTDFSQTKKKFTDEFAKTQRFLETTLKEKKIENLKLEEYPELKKCLATATQSLAELDKEKSQKTQRHAVVREAICALQKLWQAEFDSIQKQVDRINEKNSALEIKLAYQGDKPAFLAFATAIFKGSNIRNATLEELTKNYTNFGTMFLRFEEAKTKAGSSPENFERYFTEKLPELLCYQVPHKFTIRYKGKELQQHSLGQRASALILFILNQEDHKLIIIDQPEDDLDNQTIYQDLIKRINTLKPDTQFILATHNANFPVLGDAEQILACEYGDKGVGIQSGSIDAQPLQAKIIDIMEGGEEAFKKRGERYAVWNSPSS